jgi:alanine racemase
MLMWAGRATVVEINLDALSANTRALKTWLGSGVELMAVVKANAYGLGAASFARTALDSGATWLAVALVDEGVQLRQAGVRQPILVMGYAQPSEAGAAVAHHLTLTINSVELAQALDNISFQCRVVSPIHLKLDSGLTRYGRPAGELEQLARAVNAMHNLHIDGLYTHFANADEPDPSFVATQLGRFSEFRHQLAAEGISPPIIHADNSAATLAYSGSHFNLVRCGLLLHGLYPSASVRAASEINLSPVLSVRSRIARLMEIAPGDSVGYGRLFVAERPTLVATIPLGYADGYRRSLGGRAAVLVEGQRAPLIGRISMDQMTADVSGIAAVREGDEVVIVGRQGGEYIGLDELAELSETISYELSCALAPRLPRLYYRGGTLVNATTLLGREDLSLSEALPIPDNRIAPTPSANINFKRGTTPLRDQDIER